MLLSRTLTFSCYNLIKIVLSVVVWLVWQLQLVVFTLFTRHHQIGQVYNTVFVDCFLVVCKCVFFFCNYFWFIFPFLIWVLNLLTSLNWFANKISSTFKLVSSRVQMFFLFRNFTSPTTSHSFFMFSKKRPTLR